MKIRLPSQQHPTSLLYAPRNCSDHLIEVRAADGTSSCRNVRLRSGIARTPTLAGISHCQLQLPAGVCGAGVSIFRAARPVLIAACILSPLIYILCRDGTNKYAASSGPARSNYFCSVTLSTPHKPCFCTRLEARRKRSFLGD